MIQDFMFILSHNVSTGERSSKDFPSLRISCRQRRIKTCLASGRFFDLLLWLTYLFLSNSYKMADESNLFDLPETVINSLWEIGLVKFLELV